MNGQNYGQDFNNQAGGLVDMLNQLESTKQITVNKLILTPTRVYSDMYRRSMSVTMDRSSLRSMGNMLDNALTTDTKLDKHTVAKYLPDAARLSDMLGDRIDIVNGWNGHRFMFLLDVSVVDTEQSHIEHKSYIQGYTDVADLSIHGSMSDEMSLVVNSVINLTKTHVSGMSAPRVHISSCFNVITGGTLTVDKNMMHMITPSAVVETLRQESYANLNDFEGDVIAINDNTSLGNQSVRTSQRGNTIGTSYMTDLINGKIINTTGEFNNLDSDEGAYGLTRVLKRNETHINEVEFFKALATVTGVSEKFTSSFRLGALRDLDPSLNNDNVSANKILFFNRKQADQQRNMNLSNMNTFGANPLTAEDTENLANTSGLTTKAIEAVEHISSMCNALFITNVIFEFTNMTATGQPAMTMHSIKSFIPEADKIQLWRMLESRFMSESIATLTSNGALPLEFLVECNVIGESTIAISMGSGQVVYRIPTFCDSLHTSIIGSENALNGIADNMKSAFSIVDAAVYESAHNPQHNLVNPAPINTGGGGVVPIYRGNGMSSGVDNL